MAYGPGTIDQLSRYYQMLGDRGVSAWYGEAGNDNDLAIMILDGKSFHEIMDYCRETGYLEEEEEEE